MYNLVKSPNNQSDNLSKRVIDANGKFKEIRQRQEEEARFKPGIPMEHIDDENEFSEEASFSDDALFEDRGDMPYEEGAMSDGDDVPEEYMDDEIAQMPDAKEAEGIANEFTPGLNPEYISYDALAEPQFDEQALYEEPVMSDEEILESVQERAMRFIEEARDRAKRDSDELYEKAYESAIMDARAAAKEEYDRLMAEIDEKRSALSEEYEAKVTELENEFMPTLLSVFDEVLSVSIEDYRDIINELIKRTLLTIDSPRQMTIKVSTGNYEAVNDALPQIESLVGRTALIEILKEESYDDRMCTIETERGIFDCGFDTELRNLKKRVFLLSKS